MSKATSLIQKKQLLFKGHSQNHTQQQQQFQKQQIQEIAINQDIIFATIIKIGQQLYSNQSVQEITKKLYQFIFKQYEDNKQKYIKQWDIKKQILHDQQEIIQFIEKCEKNKNAKGRNQRKKQKGSGNNEKLIGNQNHNKDINKFNIQNNNTQLHNSNIKSINNDDNIIDPFTTNPNLNNNQNPSIHPLKSSSTTPNNIFSNNTSNRSQQQLMSTFLPIMKQLSHSQTSQKQKLQLLQNIKIQGISQQEQQRIKRMKLNAFKATSKHYKHMKCQLIELELEREQKIQEEEAENTQEKQGERNANVNGKGKGKDKNAQIYQEQQQTCHPNNNHNQVQQNSNTQNNPKILLKKSQNLKKKLPQQPDQLKDWFDKEQQLNEQKYLQNFQGLQKQKVGNKQKNKNNPDYYLEQENTNTQKNIIKKKGKDTAQFTAQQLKQHYQISKALCIYTQNYNQQDVKNDDPLDNPQFVSTYFNLPQFSKQDKIQLQTYKDNYLMRLDKAIIVLKTFIKYGYGMRIYKKCHPEDKTMVKDRYGNFIWFGIRVAFRQMQQYLIKHCGKNIPILSYTQLYLISLTFFRIRQMYTQKSKQTFFNILKAAFKIQGIVHISRNDIYLFYNEMRKKLVQRRDAIENKLTLTIDKQNQFAVKYHNYSEDGEIDFFGLDNGIQGIKTIYQKTSDDQIKYDSKHRRALKTWTQEFQIEFFKLYMQFRKLSEVRKHLLKRFKGAIYETEFHLKNSLNFRVQRLTRKAIELIQIHFKRYCQLMDIKQINFYQKKFLTLNFSQIRVISINQQGLDCRLLIYDYYLNNKFGKNRHDQNSLHLIKYRLTYINYLIQSMAQLLQHKKKLSDILTQPQEDRFKMFELSKIKNKKVGNHHRDNIIQLQEEDKEVHKFMIQQLEKIREYWAKNPYKSLSQLIQENRAVKKQNKDVTKKENVIKEEEIRIPKKRGRKKKIKQNTQEIQKVKQEHDNNNHQENNQQNMSQKLTSQQQQLNKSSNYDQQIYLEQ